jgi:homoserine/homoserine lactone efflux protein
MDFNIWLIFCATEFLLCISPGPAVYYVLSQGISSGYKASLAANTGVIVGSGIYFGISATGVATLLSTSYLFFSIVKWIAAAYLIWLGLNLLVEKQKSNSLQETPYSNLRKAFKGGLLIELSNPKSLIFFVAILPQFIDETYSFTTQILILGATSIFIEWFSLMLYGRISKVVNDRINNSAMIQTINKVSGGVLISIGVGMALFKQAESNV